MFFAGDALTPPDASIEKFQHATHISITLDSQNNAIRWETVYHFQSESPAACSVREGFNVFLLLREYGCDPSTPISNCSTPQYLRSISASIIIAVVRAECKQVGTARLVFALEDVGTYSLHSDRAMAMHIADVPDQALITIGWWRLLGFMVYIQQ